MSCNTSFIRNEVATGLAVREFSQAGWQKKDRDRERMERRSQREWQLSHLDLRSVTAWSFRRRAGNFLQSSKREVVVPEGFYRRRVTMRIGTRRGLWLQAETSRSNERLQTRNDLLEVTLGFLGASGKTFLFNFSKHLIGRRKNSLQIITSKSGEEPILSQRKSLSQSQIKI